MGLGKPTNLKTRNKIKHNKSRISLINVFIWCIQECLDLFVVPGPDQTFMNLFNISNQRSVQHDQPSSTILTKDREHGYQSLSFMSFIRLIRTLPVESVDGRRYSTQHHPPSVCLCSRVGGWFDTADPSTRRGWHQCESWTGGVVSPCYSKLQLTWCSYQRQSFPCFFCGF